MADHALKATFVRYFVDFNSRAIRCARQSARASSWVPPAETAK
jgi:hypothetical protein